MYCCPYGNGCAANFRCPVPPAPSPIRPGPLPFMPSVGVALYNRCEEKTADTHEELAIKELHGKACEELDEEKLAAFGVDSCKGTASKISSFVITFECVVSTMMDEDGRVYPQAVDLCFLPKMGTELEGCKEAMDEKIEEFEPVPIEELDSFESPPEDMLDSFEAVLGVFQACSSTVESYAEKGVLEPQITDFCVEETDLESAETMGVTDKSCEVQIAKPLKHMVTALCSFFVMAQVDDPSTVSPDTISIAVDEFVKHAGEMLEDMEEGGLQAAAPLRALKQQHPLAERLLRLHSVVGGEKPSGKSLFDILRKPLNKSASWSPASVAHAAAAASASALA